MKKKQRSENQEFRPVPRGETAETANPAQATESLFLSFWNICLDNLPEGTFTRSRITPDKARRRIEEARAKETLACFTEDDLLAPYHERERDNHKALCRVLDEHFGIHLKFSDFFTRPDVDGLYFSKPLGLAQVQGRSRLLVVTCMYVLPGLKKRSVGLSRLRIDPSTVEFHLFQSSSMTRMPALKKAAAQGRGARPRREK